MSATRLGCGRLLWEYDRDIVGAYGTPMAPMLLPHWTDGCIASMEGLYFESSPTVPFHFLMQSELSASPSRPMRGLPYNDPGFRLWEFTHLADVGHSVLRVVQLRGDRSGESRIRWLAATSRGAGPWSIYLVADSDVVSPLSFEPAVVP